MKKFLFSLVAFGITSSCASNLIACSSNEVIPTAEDIKKEITNPSIVLRPDVSDNTINADTKAAILHALLINNHLLKKTDIAFFKVAQANLIVYQTVSVPLSIDTQKGAVASLNLNVFLSPSNQTMASHFNNQQAIKLPDPSDLNLLTEKTLLAKYQKALKTANPQASDYDINHLHLSYEGAKIQALKINTNTPTKLAFDNYVDQNNPQVFVHNIATVATLSNSTLTNVLKNKGKKIEIEVPNGNTPNTSNKNTIKVINRDLLQKLSGKLHFYQISYLAITPNITLTTTAEDVIVYVNVPHASDPIGNVAISVGMKPQA